jgi:hypothetical protein
MAINPIRDEHDAPTSELLSGAVGDRCANCQQPLASDQRYCVNCGARRGKPRFSFDSLAAQSAPPKEPDKPHRARVPAATTLVAGVATLLLAMGVGVLIGHNSSSTPQKAAATPQVITVGGTGAATGASNAAAGSATARLKATGKVHKVKQVVVHLTAQTKAKASAAAAKVFGNSGSNLVSNPTQQVGGACSGGAGCQGGKFTGNFFSGG